MRDVLAAGLTPVVYGWGWEDFIAPGLVRRRHVGANRLGRIYASAGVVVNDHWPDMRDYELVNNRVFDVLAAGGQVISDPVAGLGDLFGGAVPTYDGPAQLSEAVAGVLGDPDAAAQRARDARALVLADHSFDVRAEQLIAVLAAHGLAPAPRPPRRVVRWWS